MSRFADASAPLDLAGARATVLGLGRSGEAAARALLERGAVVRVLDATEGDAQRVAAGRIAGAEVVLGRPDADIGEADLVVASPGIAPGSSPWFEQARSRGIPVWGEVELAYRLGVRPVIAVTGTNGKTTTTEMAAAALTACGRPALAAGNVGLPLVETVGRDLAIVAEMSSFQLEGVVTFATPVAVLLNLAHDHLDWHGSVEAYHRAKARIFERQAPNDVAVVHDDPACRRVAAGAAARVVPFHEERVPEGGAGVQDGWIVVPQGRVVEVARMRAQGRPNRADAVAAAAAVCALGCDPRAVGDALAAYEPKAHRIEPVAVLDGVRYVNDSKATDPHATLAALEEMHDVVLIAGGRNKGLDLGELAAAAPRLRAVVAIGESAADVVSVFAAEGVQVETAGSMEDAVRVARALARPGDTVLLSPACASFDWFRNYEHRGTAFKEAVAALGGGGA